MTVSIVTHIRGDRTRIESTVAVLGKVIRIFNRLFLQKSFTGCTEFFVGKKIPPALVLLPQCAETSASKKIIKQTKQNQKKPIAPNTKLFLSPVAAGG